MNHEQKAAFEAYAILQAHTNLLTQVVSQGTVEDMRAQIAMVQQAIEAVAALQDQQAKAA